MVLYKRVGMFLVCLFAVFANVFSVVLPVSAEESTPKYRMQVSPPTLDLDLQPGKSAEAVFYIQNTGREAFGFEVSATPFSVSGTDYKQDFESETAYTSLAKWITFSEDHGTVEPNAEVKVIVKVNVPKDVPFGGQYAAVMVKMVNKDNGGNESGVNTQQQIGILLYSAVEGQTRKEGSILENKVSSFTFKSAVTASSIVENTGNVHETATYTLQVYSIFGGDEVYTNEDKPMALTILPETRRLNTISWDKAPSLGIFRAKQTVKFMGKESVTEKVVFICPLWFLVIVLVVIFVIIFGIISRVRGRRV